MTSEWKAIHGFTVVYESCECGSRRVKELIGDHSGLKANAEILRMEGMFR